MRSDPPDGAQIQADGLGVIMSTVTKNFLAYRKLGWVLLGLTFGVSAHSRDAPKPLPRVISASVPLYPPSPRIAGIQGLVRLLVSTDGTQVTKVQIQSGQ